VAGDQEAMFGEDGKKVQTLILLPVRNESRHIELCIQSILNQSNLDWLLYIRDNASTDETLHICKKYQDLDKRIKVIQGRQTVDVLDNWRILADIALENTESENVIWVAGDDFWVDRDFLESTNKVLGSVSGVSVACPIFQMDFSEDKSKNNYNLSLKFDSKVRLLRIYKFLRTGAVVAHLTYGMVPRHVFQNLMKSPISKLQISEAADWFWSLAIVLQGRCIASDSKYFKRGKPLATSDLRMSGPKIYHFRARSAISNSEFIEHLLPNWKRVLRIPLWPRMIIVIYYICKDIRNVVFYSKIFFLRRLERLKNLYV
jgi:glycosyltransferase involved in cell wall biosynthesis